MQSMNVSQYFLAEIDRVAKMNVPSIVISRARKSLLDYLAVTCAGATFQKEKVEKYFAFAKPENGIYSVIGTGQKVALKEAVFLNGLNAHALDFDDGTNSGIIHLGSPIFSILLPLSQRYGTKIDDLLKAAVIGYEASYTMAISIQPKHKALGFHATGTCGVLGATLAAGYMLGFSDEERQQAFAIAAMSSSGMLKVLDDGSELKPYNVAKSALLSLTSLQLAKAGFKGHEDPLGGYRGFLKMMSGDENTKIKSVLLNGSYAIMKSYTKPYASCRYTHPPIEATTYMREKYSIKAEDVTHICVSTYSLAVSGHNHTEIQSPYSAKMSTPYSVAVALVYGKAGLAEFEPSVIDNNIISNLTHKVQVIEDKELSNTFPTKQSAIVTITTKDNIYSHRIDFPKGEPENPLNEDEFRNRYNALMEYGHIDKKIYNNIYQEINCNRHTSEIIKDL